MKLPKPRKFDSLAEIQASPENQEIPRKIKPKKKKKIGNSSPKMSKLDPDYFSKMGKISAKNRLKKLGTQYFSNLAKLSHPRPAYHGGRPRKVKPEAPVYTDSSEAV